MNDNISILLLEDDEVDVLNVRRAFKKNHINNTLHVAGNGIEALAMLRGNNDIKIIPKPKIILLDINMPRMNGIEFLTELRTDSKLKNISVFVLTTSNDDNDRIAAYDLNVAGYILKPVELESFIEAMATLNLYWTLTELP